MRRRLLTTIISVIVTILLLGVCAQAETKDGSCGTSATYSFDTVTGELTISGTGEIVTGDTFFSVVNRNAIKKVVINSGITAIGDRAFYECNNISDISIPNTVKSIGVYCFKDCQKLGDTTPLVLPDGCTDIKDFAFWGCSGLKTITIPQGVKTIGFCEFYDCKKLNNIVIPDSVTKIDSGAFNNCSELVSIKVPSSVTTFGSNAFYGCSKLTSAGPIGSGCSYEFGWTSSIPKGAFWGCGAVTSITLPSTVKTIGGYAFSNCTNLKSLNIPAGVTDIGDSAFCGCESLTGINLPASTTEIKEMQFYGCKSLVSIDLPSGVTKIGKQAFDSCASLKTINFPEGLTYIGDMAFHGCRGLESIKIPASVTYVGDLAFLYAAKIKTAGPTGSGCNYEFGWTTTIPSNAFYGCEGLKEVTFPSSINDIGNSAFSYCTNIEYVTIPNKDAAIGNNLFGNLERYDENGKTYKLPINTVFESYLGGKVEKYCKDNGYKFATIGSRPSVSPSVSPNPSSTPSNTPNTTPNNSPSATPSATGINPSETPTKSPTSEASETPSVTPESNPTDEVDVAAAMATQIPEGPSDWKDKEGSEGFVFRLYNVALTRDAEEAGLKDWDNSLTSKNKSAAEVAQGIFFSEEYQNKEYSDAQYIKFLYRTMFGREADEGGMKGWLEKLNNGLSREYVFRGFAESAEFTNLCDSYSIERGNVTLGNARDQNVGATEFVARLYTKMLGRKYEVNGIEDWTRRFLAGEVSIEDIATNGFLNSQEFENLGLNNSQFVTRMYQTFLNRNPDEGGYADWVGKLDSGERTRDDLVYGFSQSQEFANIKAQYGL